jgi:hypothetical protein
LHPGLEAAKADDVDPETVDWMDYETALTSSPNTIGFDWKEIDLGTFTWTVFDDIVYFIKTRDNDIWQLQFIDFEGSSTGVTTIRAENVGVTSSFTSPYEEDTEIQLYPNPVTPEGFSLRSSKSAGQYQIEILSADGRTLSRRKATLLPQTAVSFMAPRVSGTYYLRWLRDGESGVIPFMVP